MVLRLFGIYSDKNSQKVIELPKGNAHSVKQFKVYHVVVSFDNQVEIFNVMTATKVQRVLT